MNCRACHVFNRATIFVAAITVAVGLAHDRAFAQLNVAEGSGQSAEAGYDSEVQADPLPADEIDQIVAPIALYPDVLIAQLLPASTYPEDVVAAAAWLRSKPDMTTLPDQPWDVSVLALCHYPEVINKLGDDPDWMNALGAAFLDQPQDVMQSIQRLRASAQSAGLLQSTPQQAVVDEDDRISIVPAQEEVVYVPQYNPRTIVIDDADDGFGDVVGSSSITFGLALPLGSWLDMDCDWHSYGVAYCEPGFWSDWRHYGHRFRDDWNAVIGRRRGYVVGANGSYLGPRGVVWGDNGRGSLWRRGLGVGRPVFTGRYAEFNHYRAGANRVGMRRAIAGRDAPGRTSILDRRSGGDRGDRAAPRVGDRARGPNADRANRTTSPRERAGGTSVGSAPNNQFQQRARASEVLRESQRGAASRQSPTRGTVARPSGSTPTRSVRPPTTGARPAVRSGNAAPARSTGGTPAQSPGRGVTRSVTRTPAPAARPATSFGDARGRAQVSQSSGRGAVSRGAVSRGGGGRRP